MKMKKIILTGLFAFSLVWSSTASFAQCKDVVWPENPEMKAKAEESKVLYEDAHRAGQFKQAVAPLNWLLKNVPNFHSSLYILGAEIYDKLATDEKNPARKKVYIDSLLIVYDMRLQYCGDEANVLPRKATAHLKHLASDKPVETLQLLDKSIEIQGANFNEAYMMPYMQVVRIAKFNKKALTDDQVLQRYDKISALLDTKIQKAQSEGKPVDKLRKVKEDVDGVLMASVEINCDFVRKNMGPKFKQNPKDLDLAKKIFAFMMKDKCTDDPLWMEAGEAIHRLTPANERDCGLAKNLAIRYLSNENYDKAQEYFREAQGICTDASKGEVLIYLGKIESRKGNKSAARQLFREAASTDAQVAKDAYENIGDLYYNAFNDCKELKSHADDRLVFLLAADYYAKAGNGKKVAQAKESFPSKTEIFEKNYEVGETKTVGCWINESTTLRTRD
jgi:tetratricopeptide (TPR) repeat protein